MTVSPNQVLREAFRFRLRTVFIFCALLSLWCAWASYSQRWIKQRHEALARGKVAIVQIDSPLIRFAPGGLWLWGEYPMAQIRFVEDSKMTLQQMRDLFPEANVKALTDSDFENLPFLPESAYSAKPGEPRRLFSRH